MFGEGPHLRFSQPILNNMALHTSHLRERQTVKSFLFFIIYIKLICSAYFIILLTKFFYYNKFQAICLKCMILFSNNDTHAIKNKQWKEGKKLLEKNFNWNMYTYINENVGIKLNYNF